MPMKDQCFRKSSGGTLQDGPRRVQLQEAAQPAGVGDGVRRKRRRTDALFGGGPFFRGGFAADAEFFFGDAEKPVIPRLGDATIVSSIMSEIAQQMPLVPAVPLEKVDLKALSDRAKAMVEEEYGTDDATALKIVESEAAAEMLRGSADCSAPALLAPSVIIGGSP